MQDVPGTAQGNWFLTETSSAFTETDETIALVHDNVDPVIPVFSVSNTLPGTPTAAYRFSPVIGAGSVNRDFADVVPGAVYCYENVIGLEDANAGIFLMEVFSSGGNGEVDRLRIERRADLVSCPAEPRSFSEAAVVFQR